MDYNESKARATPSDWTVTSNDGITLVATNRVTKEIFTGTPANFNLLFTGGLPETSIEGAAKAYPVATLGANQKLTVGSSSSQSAAIDAYTIRVTTTTDMYMEIGSNPAATTNSAILLAGSTEYFHISKGHKVAVLQLSSAGIATVTAVSI